MLFRRRALPWRPSLARFSRVRPPKYAAPARDSRHLHFSLFSFATAYLPRAHLNPRRTHLETHHRVERTSCLHRTSTHMSPDQMHAGDMLETLTTTQRTQNTLETWISVRIVQEFVVSCLT
jgi:hypothetical protein